MKKLIRKTGYDRALEKILLKMKLTAAIFLFCLASVSASTYAQNTRLDISSKGKSIVELFREIEEKSEFYFFYQKEDLKEMNDVSVDVKNATVMEILDKVLAGTNLDYKVVDRYIVVRKSGDTFGENIITAQQQQRAISGKVTDTRNQPLPGVTVVVKGTTQGTVTNADGEYTLSNIPANTTLQFSFVGMKTTEVVVGSQTSISVAMEEETIGIDEVVAIGYGTQKRVNLTGAVATANGEELTQSPSVSLSNSFAGRLPGIIATNRSGEPGNDVAGLLIRGKSTLGSTSPLIVIDGVWGRSGYDQIDPRDIESVSVLKDASAAIYGAQAANGVILITTKRGKTGKPTINYTYNQGITQPTRLPELADAASYAELYNDLLNAQGQNDKFSAEEIQKFRDGSDPLNYPNTDWIDATLKNFSTQSQHNLSLRGGNEMVKYYLSGNYSNQESMFKHGITNYNTFGIRSNIDANVTENIKISVDLSVQQQDKMYPNAGTGTIMNSMWRNYPFLVDRYSNGLPGTGIERGENPVVMATDATGYRKTKVNRYQSTVSFDIKIPQVKGLGIDGFFAYDKTHNYYKNFSKPWYVYMYNQSTSTYDEKLGGSVTNPQLTEQYTYSSRWTANAKIKYERRFDEHSINSFIAMEQTENNSNYFSAFRKNYLSDAIDQLYAGDENNQEADGSASESARRNYFGRVSYGFQDKYLLDFNFRYDGSSNFPEDKRWGFFPGVSVGWRISEEKFLGNLTDKINNLKLRASYGKMGNDDIDPFQYLATYSFTSGYFLGADQNSVKGILQGVTPNPYITWEVAKTLNLGLDGEFWDGLFGVNLDVFKTERSNILTKRNASIPVYTGLVLPSENIGVVENKGFELALSHKNTIDQLKYEVSGNIGFARNKIVDIDEAENAQTWQMQTGHVMGTSLYYQATGIYRTQEEIDATPHPSGTRIGDLIYKDVNDDKKIDSKDMVRMDRTNTPEIVYGLNLSLGYKQFDMGILFQGQARAWQYIYLQSGLQGNTLKDLIENRYTEDNPNSKYPNLTSYTSEVSGYQSTFWLKDASFLRLKNLEIGYNLPSSLLNKVHIEALRFYVSGYNLLTFDKLKWFDPEGNSTTAAFYPQNRIFNIGLNLTF